MSVERRVWLCRLIEGIYEQKEFCDRAGIINVSTFEGTYVESMQHRGTEADNQQT